jgi:hypothetical protein
MISYHPLLCFTQKIPRCCAFVVDSGNSHTTEIQRIHPYYAPAYRLFLPIGHRPSHYQHCRSSCALTSEKGQPLVLVLPAILIRRLYWYASVNTSVENSGGKILLRRGMYFTGTERGLGKNYEGHCSTRSQGPREIPLSPTRTSHSYILIRRRGEKEGSDNFLSEHSERVIVRTRS